MAGIMRFAGVKAIDYIKRGKRGEVGVADKLRQSYAAWASLSDAAYGTADRIPKFNFAQHIWEQLKGDVFIMDCFATKRQNSMWIQAGSQVGKHKKF